MEKHEEARRCFHNGRNVFLTGQGGTGKTHLSSELIKEAISKERKPLLCAPTGIAALVLGGRTIHSLLGLPPSLRDLTQIQRFADGKYRRNRRRDENTDEKIQQIANADVLVIDECSMMGVWLFQAANIIFQTYRNDFTKPFGGIQLLLVGDFRQLPPVCDSRNSDGFCFECDLWTQLNIVVVELQKMYRQTDPQFIELLRRIAMGELLSVEQSKLLCSRAVAPEKSNPIVQIKYTRKSVWRTNNIAFNKLIQAPRMPPLLQQEYNVPLLTWKHRDETDQALDQCVQSVKEALVIPMEAKIQKFCVGSRVMMIRNVPTQNLVNGHTGTIISFARRLEAECPTDPEYVPIVKFDHGVTRIIGSYEWTIHNYTDSAYGQLRIRVVAIPLILAWACTVHKVQGSTIHSPVEIDCVMMDKIPATFYVAMSRATTLDKIFLRNFNGQFAHCQKAVDFYRSLPKTKGDVTQSGEDEKHSIKRKRG